MVGGLNVGPEMPAVLHRALEKAIALAQSPVAGYVARLRRARPLATPAEIIALLEKQYLAAVTGTGAAVGGAAVAPGVGTVAALALTGGETALFLETTTLLALAVAEVHGIRVEEVERRRTLVLAVALGDNGAMLVEKMAGRGGQQWGALLPDAIPMSSITAINKTLGRWFLNRYGRKQGVLALGRIAPFGIGVAIGTAGNRAFGRVVVETSRRVFGPPPAHFPDGSTVTIIEGTVD
ncbi:MAG TPA: hypothetical protein VFW64_08240 [Pseudonocardiaceae bacterium]|nr:hypothetical protein [Pseudonocardiaceae bacterium]